jgi:transposase
MDTSLTLIFREEVCMAKGKEIRRSFTAEFKFEAVRRLQSRPVGVSVAHIGRELGVRPDMLREWARQAEGRVGQNPTEVFPGQGKAPAEEAELRQLRRENARLAEENAFLKIAAAYFAREEP